MASKEEIPALIAELKHRDEDVRLEALAALKQAAPAAVAGLGPLTDSLRCAERRVRARAAEALAALGAVAVEPLCVALRESNEYGRANAAFVLGEIGHEARAAVPHLLGALQDGKANVRGWAAEALG